MNNTTVIIPARLSYAYVNEPSERDGKYSCQLLIDKTDTQAVERIKAGIAAAVEANKHILANKQGVVQKGFKQPLRDGDEERDGAEYQGMYFMNCTSKYKPGLFDRHRQPILDGSEVYSGCHANVAVNFFAYSRDGNRGISGGLQAIQKVKDGERLGGSTFNANSFEDLGGDSGTADAFGELFGG